MPIQVILSFLHNSTPQQDLAFALLVGKCLTTIVSLALAVALDRARQTLVASRLNQSEQSLSFITIEPIWSFSLHVFKKAGNYARLCLLLAILSSWSWLSGLILPVGLIRPTTCPVQTVQGPVSSLFLDQLTGATASSRVSMWYNLYATSRIPQSSIYSYLPSQSEDLASFINIDTMSAGSNVCKELSTPPPEINGTIGLELFQPFATADSNAVLNYLQGQEANLIPGNVSAFNVSQARFGFNYLFLPKQALVNGFQVLDWASAIGYFSYASSPTTFTSVHIYLGTTQNVSLWNAQDVNITQSFSFNLNRAVTCTTTFNQGTNMTGGNPLTVYDPSKAAAVMGDFLHGTFLQTDLTSSQISQITIVNAAITLSQFGMNPTNFVTGQPQQANFGTEQSCIIIGDLVISYYVIGIFLTLAAFAYSGGGMFPGPLSRTDIPTSSLGWIHFINNISNPGWLVGVEKVGNKEMYLSPDFSDESALLSNGEGAPPKVDFKFHGNQVSVVPKA